MKESDLYEEFSKGEFVRLDKGFSNSSLVEVISQTPQKMFTLVKDKDSQWETMTYRLSRD